MKRILTLSLAILMLTSLLFGCAEEDSPLLGTWTGQINDASRINLLLADTYGAEMAEYWKIEEFNIPIIMTFRADGTYRQAVDKDALNGSMEQLKQVLNTGLTKFLEDLIAASDTDITVEELMQSMNISVEDLLDAAFSAEAIRSVESDYTSEGKFEAADGKLYTSVGLEFDIDKNWYEIYEISGDTLTLLSLHCEENGPPIDQDQYPITLTRTK